VHASRGGDCSARMLIQVYDRNLLEEMHGELMMISWTTRPGAG
jgi:hypothetical protein